MEVISDPLWIQRHTLRWTGDDNEMAPSADGEYVRYADHVEVVDIAIARASTAARLLAADAAAHEAAAVAAAEQRAVDEFLASDTMKVIRSQESQHGYLQGQRDAEARIRAGVEALDSVYLGSGRGVIKSVLAVIDATPHDEEAT